MEQIKFWLKVTGLALLLHAGLTLLSILEVAIYSHLIVSGREEAFYQEHAQASGPVDLGDLRVHSCLPDRALVH